VPASKRQMNWSGVGFTPSGGIAQPAGGVTEVAIDTGGNLVKFSGDNDRGPTLVVNDFNEPTVMITSADAAWLLGLIPGSVGAVTATHKDAKLAALGDIVYTMSPAVVEGPSVRGQHRQVGSGTVKFIGVYADGVTNPISFTRA